MNDLVGDIQADAKSRVVRPLISGLVVLLEYFLMMDACETNPKIFDTDHRETLLGDEMHNHLLCLYLSMISGTNFESESGQLFLVRLAKIVKFGSHMTTKKGNELTCANEKGSPPLACRNVDVLLRRQMLGAKAF